MKMMDGAHKAVCPHPVPIHPLCCHHGTGIGLSKDTSELVFFLSVKRWSELGHESPVGTRMTHLVWMGAKWSCQAEALTLVTSKANEFHLPVSGAASSKREKASLPRLPSKELPSCALTWNLFGSYFSGAFQLRVSYHFTPSAGLCFPKARIRHHLLWTLQISEINVIPKNSPN